MKKISNGFDVFLQKAIKNQETRRKPFILNLDGFGEVEFIRPSNEEILKYVDEISNAVVVINDEATNTDMIKLHEASSKLVYVCCPYLQEKSLQESLSISNPFDTPSEVFGATMVLDIASQIMEKIEGKEIIEDINKKIKN